MSVLGSTQEDYRETASRAHSAHSARRVEPTALSRLMQCKNSEYRLPPTPRNSDEHLEPRYQSPRGPEQTKCMEPCSITFGILRSTPTTGSLTSWDFQSRKNVRMISGAPLAALL